MLKVVLFLVSIIGLTLASQTIPLPKTLDGLSLGHLNSSFSLEAHYDLLCPDSRNSYYILSQVMRDYNLSTSENFKFTIHFFPLPYHTFAHKVAIGERFVQDNYGVGKAWEYTDFMFRNQETFYNGNISNLSISQVEGKLGRLIERNLEIPSSSFVSALEDPNYDGETRISWKFGCSRTVSGAPFYFVNGIKVDDAPSFQYADWVNFLKDYFSFAKNEEKI